MREYLTGMDVEVSAAGMKIVLHCRTFRHRMAYTVDAIKFVCIVGQSTHFRAHSGMQTLGRLQGFDRYGASSRRTMVAVH
jgi:hypothetical protein